MLRDAKVEYLQWLKGTRVRFARTPLLASGLVTPLEELEPEDAEILGPKDPGEDAARIRALLAGRYGVPEGEVLPVLGTSLALFLVCAAVLRPGDVVLAEAPAYEPLRRVPEAVGARVMPFRRVPAGRWRVEPERVLDRWDEKVKMVLVSDLHNPTGRAAGDESLKTLAEEAERRGAVLFVDEVYRDFRPGAVGTARGMGPAVITASSLTKVYGFGTLRAGWVLAPPEVVARMQSIEDVLHVMNPGPTQALARKALERAEDWRRKALRTARDGWRTVENWLHTEEELSIVKPDGGIHAWILLPSGRSGSEVASELLREHEVAVVPGRFFGDDGGVRVGLGGNAASLREGLSALARVVIGR